MLAYLIPDLSDLANLAAVWGSGLVLLLFGRALCLGRGLPEIQAVAGWGGLCILLTGWGVLLPQSLFWPSAAVVIIAAVALLAPPLRPGREDWIAFGRIMVLSLPLWAIMLTARPSQPDTFLNLLPNAAYLYDHGILPSDARPPSHSLLPAAPYDLQFWAYLAGLALPQFPASAMVHINLLLHLVAGLLLARVVRSGEGGAEPAPGWGTTACGLLLATALNPGFVPRIYFASYSEASVAVALCVAGWLINRIAGRAVEGEGSRHLRVALAFVLAALVNIKQESVAFVAGLAAAIALLGLIDRRLRFWPALKLFAPAFLPAAALYVLWRWFVMTHFVGGELTLLPIDQWHPEMVPMILGRMLEVVGEKGVFFGFLALAGLALIRRLGADGWNGSARLLALLLGVFLAYNAFLLFMYVAHFAPVMSADAHSFFRYNTHLSLLLVIALTAAAREEFGQRSRPASKLGRLSAGFAIVLMLVVPAAFAKRLRFDLDMPQPLIRAIGHGVARMIGPNDRLGLVLPGDNGSVATMLGSVLRDTPPRRPNVDLSTADAFDDATLANFATQGYDKVLISCVGDHPGGPPGGRAVYLEQQDGSWQQRAEWRYPDPDDRRWTSVLAAAPLCR